MLLCHVAIVYGGMLYNMIVVCIVMADCYNESIGGSLKLKGVSDGGIKK